MEMGVLRGSSRWWAALLLVVLFFVCLRLSIYVSPSERLKLEGGLVYVVGVARDVGCREDGRCYLRDQSLSYLRILRIQKLDPF